MKRLATAALGFLAAIAIVAAAGAPPARSGGAALEPRVLTSWSGTAHGGFAESAVLGADGYVYVSMTTWSKKSDRNVGQIWKVSPQSGARTRFGPRIAIGMSTVTGVAFDRYGRLYAGVAAFGGPARSGVYRVDAGSATRILTLPANTFPNGLAFHGDDLYVSDSVRGAIWKLRPGTPQTLSVPWLTNRLLMPGNPSKNKAAHGLGANGIAFRGSHLYVGSSDQGAIVRVTVGPSGAPGEVTLYAKRPALKTVDGLAFDSGGNLWLTANGPGKGRIELMTPAGKVRVLADRTSWLDYPTQAVPAAGLVYLVNGSFQKGVPNLLVFEQTLST